MPVALRALTAACMLGLVPYQAFADDLLTVYQTALASDPQLRAAAANRSAAGENLPIARSALLPSVSASGDVDANHQKVYSSPAGNSSNSFASATAALSASYPLYRKDRSIQVEQADNAARQADEDFRFASQGLMLRVAQAYFGVLAAGDTLVFSKSEKKAISRQLDQAKQRFDVGLIAITGVHEAQARYDQAVADEISALNALDNAREALREITGRLPPTLARLAAEIPLASPQPEDADAWNRIGLENSPGVQSARYAAEIARQEMEVKRAGDDFTVDLVGSYSLTRTGSSTGSDVNNAAIGVQLAKPLYTGGGVAAATRQAQFQFQAAQEALDQQRRSVTRQVRDAYRGVISSISRVTALKAARRSAQSALEATEAGFEVGTRTLVDVLNSQRDLFRARRDYAQARYDYVLNSLVLTQAAGTLTEDDLRKVNGWLSADD